MQIFTATFILVVSCSAFAIHYGDQPTLKKSETLATVLGHPEKFRVGEVLINSKIDTVCQEKGCWMVLKDERQQIRVTFKNYGFFVPKDLANSRCNVQGKLVEKTLSVGEARHYLKDEGKSKAEIAKVTEPQKVLHFVATGVEVLSAKQ